MAQRKLNESELEELLTHYRSERRRLIFQLDRVREVIAHLKSDGTTGPQRIQKPAAKSTYRRKPGRKKKRTISNGGYRLSDWDEMIVKTITDKDQLMPKSDLLVASVKWAKKAYPKMTEDEIAGKLTRVLQKLSGKRGILGAHRSGLRRGYHYGIKDWFFSSSGGLRKKHLDRLVLAD